MRGKRRWDRGLRDIEKRFRGRKWFVEGEIKGLLEKIEENVLIGSLGKGIGDDRFVRVMGKLLNGGYIEEWKFDNRKKGSGEGGNMSGIVGKIYVDNFEKYMEE